MPPDSSAAAAPAAAAAAAASDPNVLSPAQIRLTNAECGHLFKLEQGTKEEFNACVLGKWSDRAMSGHVTRLLDGLSKAKKPKSKQERVDMLYDLIKQHF